jgi:hypothetical protein
MELEEAIITFCVSIFSGFLVGLVWYYIAQIVNAKVGGR